MRCPSRFECRVLQVVAWMSLLFGLALALTRDI